MNREELARELGQTGAGELLESRSSPGSPTTDRTAYRA